MTYILLEYPSDDKEFAQNVEIIKSDVQVVLNQIKEVFLKIKNGDFVSGCGCLKKENGVYPCDDCFQVILNLKPKYDNRSSLEITTYQQSFHDYRNLSVSRLNHFLLSPKSVYFDDVLQLTLPVRLSGPKKEYQAKETKKYLPTGSIFGTVMHGTLGKIFKENLILEKALKYHDELLQKHKDEIIETMPAN